MNAIILAAGMGNRLGVLTRSLPKCLLEIDGKSIVERQIDLLLAHQVEKIVVVTGYLYKTLDWLGTIPQVEIIRNSYYRTTNNLYSLWLASSFLGNSFVLDADLYLEQDIFSKKTEVKDHSYYWGVRKTSRQEEWVLETDKDGFLCHISKRVLGLLTPGLCHSGISYWNKKDGRRIRELLDLYVKEEKMRAMYWDQVVLDHLSSFRLKVVETEGLYEIDTPDDLQWVKNRVEKKKLDCKK